MSAAAGQALGDQISRSGQENELNVAGAFAQDIAISSLERGARDDDAPTRFLMGTNASGQRAQPVGAIGVGERNAGRHFLDVLLGMEFISFHELEIEGVGEAGSDQAFAGAGDSHHHETAGIHQPLIWRPVVFVRTLRLWLRWESLTF